MPSSSALRPASPGPAGAANPPTPRGGRWPRAVVASAVCASAIVLAACGKSEADLMQQARARIAQQDFQGAAADLKSILQRNPKSGTARLALGEVLLQQGQPAAAQAELERAREAGQPADRVVPLLAQAMLASGQGRQMLEKFGETRLADKGAQADLEAYRAAAVAQRGDLAQAVTLAEQLAKANPDRTLARLTLARLLLAAKRPQDALAEVEAVTQRDPKSADAWALKGDLLWPDPAQQSAAREAYRTAQREAPRSLHAAGALVALELKAGDTGAAEDALAKLRAIAPKAAITAFYDAQVGYSKRDFRRAKVAYQALLGAAPSAPQYLLGAAETEMQLGDLGAAETNAARAVAVAPDMPLARRLLAQVQLRQGQAAKALQTLGPLADAPDASPEVVALAAEALQRNGQKKEADAMLARLAKAKTPDARLRTMAAVSSLGKGSAGDEAVFEQLRAISAEDRGVTADLAALEARLRARQFDEASKVVDVIDAKMPNRAYPIAVRGQVAARRGDLVAARAAYEEALKREPNFMPAVAALTALDLEAGKPDAARARLVAMRKLEPKNAKIALALADLDLRAGKPQSEVAKLLDEAIKADPTDATARLALIALHQAGGDARAALSAAQSAVAALPSNVDVLDRLAKVQASLGERDQALASYGKIAALQPKSNAADLGMAEVYIQGKQWASATELIQTVLQRDPENVPALGLAVLVDMARKEPAKALPHTRTLQRVRPDDALGWLLEAELMAAQNQREPALQLLRTATTKANPGKAAIKLHAALLQERRPVDADAFMGQWLREHPNDVDARFYMAEIARELGRVDEAMERYREVLKLAPSHALAANNLAMELLRKGQPGAGELIDRALQRMPNHPALIDTKAQVLAKEGNVAEAIKMQERAIALAPRAAALRLQLAQFLWDADRKSDARNELQRLKGDEANLTPEQRVEVDRRLKQMQTR